MLGSFAIKLLPNARRQLTNPRKATLAQVVGM
jgi:hypothetical protein